MAFRFEADLAIPIRRALPRPSDFDQENVSDIPIAHYERIPAIRFRETAARRLKRHSVCIVEGRLRSPGAAEEIPAAARHPSPD